MALPEAQKVYTVSANDTAHKKINQKLTTYFEGVIQPGRNELVLPKMTLPFNKLGSTEVVIVTFQEIIKSAKAGTYIATLPVHNKHFINDFKSFLRIFNSDPFALSDSDRAVRIVLDGYAEKNSDAARTTYLNDPKTYEHSTINAKSMIINYVANVAAIFLANLTLTEALDYDSERIAEIPEAFWKTTVSTIRGALNTFQAKSAEDFKDYKFSNFVDLGDRARTAIEEKILREKSFEKVAKLHPAQAGAKEEAKEEEAHNRLLQQHRPRQGQQAQKT